LRAALCTLKLANARAFDKLIEPGFFEAVAFNLQVSRLQLDSAD
jgi:hypothetical protein